MRPLRRIASVTVCLAALGLSEVAFAGHNNCHALIGGVPGSTLSASCSVEVLASTQLQATITQNGSTVTVYATDGLNDYLEVTIEGSDGSYSYLSTTSASVNVDLALLQGQAEGTFELDGVTYEVDAYLEGEGETALENWIQLDAASSKASRSGSGTLSLNSSDGVYAIDGTASGKLRRVTGYQSLTVDADGCLGPICVS